MDAPARFERILGIPFVAGKADEAIERVCRDGGLVVMPSGPALLLLSTNSQYRHAVMAADLVLPDSALMVLTWKLIQRSRIRKLSGLRYLRTLLRRAELREPGASFWVMPSAVSAQRNAAWLRAQGVPVAEEQIYVAPRYGALVEDAELLHEIELRKPRHILLGVAGGIQEQLGHYLKNNLSFRPAIHCIGAAIAFLSGDQVRIPVWVDRAGLGWLWRIGSNPPLYIPRYWSARRIVFTLLRYRDRLPIAGERAIPVPTAMPSAPLEP